ncbi:class I SAM-dependent RNA methyltransferase [Candidatus Saccharibacteria bacterium]|nr:class I SAM-dependent RNA methyltransferase [Candidatus Saccharibacteria bacterium]
MSEVRVEKLVPGGQGLATLADGQKIFLWNVLPGELVEFDITKRKRRYCEAIATNIIESSPQRVTARDDCYLATSPWQVFDYDFELQQKAQLVQECFRQQKLDVTVLPTITDGHDFHYRNKMEYSLYWDNNDDQIYPAFHLRGTHRKIPIQQSSIERPEIFQAAQQIITELNARQAAARDYQSLLIRCDQQGRVSSALFEKGKAHPIMPQLQDSLLGHTYSYSPNGFFQINLPVYELVLQNIAAQIQTDQVLDLYAGVGSIGLSVAHDKQLTLVEVNAAAYAEMQNNARGTTAHCILAKSEEVTDYITPNCTVILDPPRAGCDTKLIAKLQQIRPAKIIYLSCNPITQARDVATLAADFTISALQPYNFFPRTPHIENLLFLTRK